jgi:histidinol-phosphate aminotransferase
MPGYSWGEQPEDDKTTKLNTNENPYPPSPAVQAALSAIDVSKLRTYPQPTADPLRDAIALRHGVARENIVVTNGGDEALRLAITTFIEPGCNFGMATPSYSLYRVLADIHDATVVEVALNEDWSLPSDFAAQLNAQQVQLTCVVNPHAPSGALASTETLSQVAEALDGVLLVDEAYVDFVDPEMGYDSAQLIDQHDNVLILRTFSKGYSLAGLRLGYLLGAAELIDPIVSKTRDSYNISHVSQQLGLAAFTDLAYAADTWGKVRQERQRLQNNLSQLGLTSPPSQSNFLLASIAGNTRWNASQLYEHLKREGILVRFFDVTGMDDKLRITVGTVEDNDRLVETLTAVLT